MSTDPSATTLNDASGEVPFKALRARLGAHDDLGVVEMHRTIALRMLREGSAVQAFQELVRACRIVPMNARLASSLVYLALRAKTYGPALTLLAQGVDETDGDERVGVMRHLARLARKANELERARESLVHLLAERPQDRRARAVLNALLEREERWDELDASLEKETKEALRRNAPLAASRSALRRARMWDARLNDQARAALRYMQAAQYAEKAEDLERSFYLRLLWLHSLQRSGAPGRFLEDAVAVTWRAGDRVGQASRVTALVAELGLPAPKARRPSRPLPLAKPTPPAPAPPRKSSVELELLAVADAAEKSGKRAVAAAVLTAAVREGEDPLAVAKLEAHYLQRGAWRPLADFYREQMGRAPTPSDRASWAEKLAELLESELDDPAGAAAAWAEVVTQTGDSHAVAEQVRLLARRRDPTGVRAALDAGVEKAVTKDERAKALVLRAEEALTRKETALARVDLEKALVLMPGYPEAAAGLAELASAAGDGAPTLELAAALGLMPIHGRGRGDLYRRLARLAEVHLDAERAKAAWDEVLVEIAGDEEALARRLALSRSPSDKAEPRAERIEKDLGEAPAHEPPSEPEVWQGSEPSSEAVKPPPYPMDAAQDVAPASTSRVVPRLGPPPAPQTTPAPPQDKVAPSPTLPLAPISSRVPASSPSRPGQSLAPEPARAPRLAEASPGTATLVPEVRRAPEPATAEVVGSQERAAVARPKEGVRVLPLPRSTGPTPKDVARAPSAPSAPPGLRLRPPAVPIGEPASAELLTPAPSAEPRRAPPYPREPPPAAIGPGVAREKAKTPEAETPVPRLAEIPTPPPESPDALPRLETPVDVTGPMPLPAARLAQPPSPAERVTLQIHVSDPEVQLDRGKGTSEETPPPIAPAVKGPVPERPRAETPVERTYTSRGSSPGRRSSMERVALFERARANPLEPVCYRLLAEYFDGTGDPTRAALMRELSDALEGVAQVTARAPPLILTGNDRLAIKHPTLRADAGELIGLVGRALCSLYPTQGRDAGTGVEFDFQSGPGARATAEALSAAIRVVGLKAPPVFLSADDGPPFSLVFVGQPRLLVGAVAIKRVLDGAELRFFAGRALFTQVPEMMPLRLLRREQILKGLAAVSELGTGQAESTEARVLKDALAPAAWERVRALLASLGSRLDVSQLADGARHTANRAGLVVCGAVGPALAALRAKKALQSEITELVRFAASERYLQLRSRYLAARPTAS